jgi:hypothetical protein
MFDWLTHGNKFVSHIQINTFNISTHRIDDEMMKTGVANILTYGPNENHGSTLTVLG